MDWTFSTSPWKCAKCAWHIECKKDLYSRENYLFPEKQMQSSVQSQDKIPSNKKWKWFAGFIVQRMVDGNSPRSKFGPCWCTYETISSKISSSVNEKLLPLWEGWFYSAFIRQFEIKIESQKIWDQWAFSWWVYWWCYWQMFHWF